MLTELDEKIIHALEKNARTSTTELAKALEEPRHVIAYRVAHLEKNNFINNYELRLDLNRLGFKEYILYLKIHQYRTIKDKLTSFFQKNDYVRWAAETFPFYNLRVVIFAQHFSELEEVIDELKELAGDKLLETEILSVRGQVKNQVYAKAHETEKGDIKLKKQDGKLIGTLYKNPKATLQAIANNTGYSIEGARKRMKELEKQKLILGYAAHLNKRKIGFNFWLQLLVKINPSQENRNKLNTFLFKHHNIGKSRLVFGKWDVEMTLFVKTHEDLNRIVEDLETLFGAELQELELLFAWTRLVKSRLPKAVFGETVGND